MLRFINDVCPLECRTKVHYLFYIERAQCSFLYLFLNFFMGFTLLMGLYVV